MLKSSRVTRILAGCVLLFSGCGLFDSGVVWRDGQYALSWIDLPDEVTLSYDMGHGSSIPLVEPRVFAVGADDRYVIAQQHPAADRTITNYFIVDRRQDVLKQLKTAVVGPLTEKEFQARSTALKLPSFTKVLGGS
jgi:hypothetical protein